MSLSIILNEERYALSCIQDRSIGESSWLTAQILAKYYYWELGYRKKKIEKELTEFIRWFSVQIGGKSHEQKAH